MPSPRRPAIMVSGDSSEIAHSIIGCHRRSDNGVQFSESAGTEAGKYVVAIGRKEIPIGRPRNPCAARPGAAAQYLSRAEPRLRIILIRIGDKAGKRRKVGGRPFPDIADHLPAAERAVALDRKSVV